eukprot:Em0017g943a
MASCEGLEVPSAALVPYIYSYLLQNNMMKAANSLKKEARCVTVDKVDGPGLVDFYKHYRASNNKRPASDDTADGPPNKKGKTSAVLKQTSKAAITKGVSEPQESDNSSSSSSSEDAKPQLTTLKPSITKGIIKAPPTATPIKPAVAADSSDSSSSSEDEALPTPKPSVTKAVAKAPPTATPIKPPVAADSSDSSSSSEDEGSTTKPVDLSDSSSSCEDEDAKPVQTLLSKTTSQTKVVAKGDSKAVTKAPPTTKPPVADSSDSSSSSEEEILQLKLMRSLCPYVTIVKTTKPTPKPSVSKAPPTKPVDSSDSSSSSEDEDAKPVQKSISQTKVVAKGDSKAVAKAPPTATPIKPPVTADSSDSSSSSEDEVMPTKPAVLAQTVASKPTPKPSVSKAPPTKPVDSSDSSSSSEDEDAKPVQKSISQTKVVAKGDSKAVTKAPPTATPIKPPVAADSSDSSSSSEDEDEKTTVNAKAVSISKMPTQTTLAGQSVSKALPTVKPTKPLAPASSSDSSSDDDTPIPTAKPAQTATAVKPLVTKAPPTKPSASSSDSTSSEEEATTPAQTKRTLNGKAAPANDGQTYIKVQLAKTPGSDSQPSKAAPSDDVVTTPANKTSKNMAKEKANSAPFRRIKEEEIFVDPRLRDNSFEAKKGAYGSWGEKANKDLKCTKGKSFRHEKTKKKRGSYKGGAIDMGVNSIKFDSD